MACNVDPSNVAGDENPMEIEAMDIKPLEVEAYVPPEETALELGLDPVLVWKAAVLRALRSADEGLLTISSLSIQAPSPAPEKPYSEHVREHIVGRLLAKWVVENESIQLLPV